MANTKFDVGDVVYHSTGYDVNKDTISTIMIQHSGAEYTLRNRVGKYRERDLFGSWNEAKILVLECDIKELNKKMKDIRDELKEVKAQKKELSAEIRRKR